LHASRALLNLSRAVEVWGEEGEEREREDTTVSNDVIWEE